MTDPIDDETKVWKKLERKEERYEREQRFLRKDSEEYEALEEVFDKATLMAVYKLMNDGIISRFHGIVSAGKEARIYSGEDSKGQPIAIKIYLTVTAEFRKGRMKYILGDPRFLSVSKDIRKLINLWASKEFKNLKKAYDAGVNVPRPIHWLKNVVVMEFIGDNFIPAPLLREVEVDENLYLAVLEEVRKLYVKANLIHTDLSEYNIFVYNDRVILFDFAQAVLKDHPLSEKFLIRDISNINDFFMKRGLEIVDLENALKFVKGEIENVF